MTSLAKILIDYGYHKLDEPRPRRVRHWASDAGRCLRALVYQWRGEKPDRPDGRKFFIFSDGQLHHQAIVKQLEEAGVEVTMKEAPIHDLERNLSGKLDALIRLDGKYYVLEVKSVNRYSFDEILRDGPRDDHILQLQLYLYYVQNLYKIDTKQGWILYKNKDTSLFYDYLIDYNESYVQVFFNQLKTIEEYVSKGILPDRPYERTDWHCQYCDYENTCWQGVTPEKIVQITDEELVKLLGELVFVREQRKNYEMKEEILADRLKELFKEKGIFEGQIGSYLVRLEEMKMRRLNQKKLAEILGDRINEFYEEKLYSKLTIKELLSESF